MSQLGLIILHSLILFPLIMGRNSKLFWWGLRDALSYVCKNKSLGSGLTLYFISTVTTVGYHVGLMTSLDRVYWPKTVSAVGYNLQNGL